MKIIFYLVSVTTAMISFDFVPNWDYDGKLPGKDKILNTDFNTVPGALTLR